MTKEKILQIDAYCLENGVSKATHLRELGVTPNCYYSSRRRYFDCDIIAAKSCDTTAKQKDQTIGFLPIQFTHASKTVTPNPTTRSQRKREQAFANGNNLLIEMRTPSGTELRIQGQINITMLKEIIHASSYGSDDV